MNRPSLSRALGIFAAMVGMTSMKNPQKIPMSKSSGSPSALDSMDTPQAHNAPTIYTKTPLTRKQAKGRVRNQMAKESRKVNR